MATGAESTHVVDGITARAGVALAGTNGTLTYLSGDGAARLLVGGVLVNAGMPYNPEGSIIQPYLAEDAWTTVTLTGGTFFATRFTATQTLTVSSFVGLQSGSAASASVCRVGLYTVAADQSGTLVARTSGSLNDFQPGWMTIAFNTTGGFPASYQVTAGGVYAVGVFQTGAATPPAWTAKSFQTVPGTTPALGLYRRSIALTAQSDCPTTFAANVAQGVFVPWIGLV